jgi:AcrR family transcriptional regulator
MSDEQSTARRRYRKRRRAEQEAETRRRITEAAVDLHGSVGPAQTTVSAVAERAGVQRATVYRHFPDEEALFAACSSHWISAHPLPDPGDWSSIADPDTRLRTVLDEVYAWYEGGEEMLERTIRDAPLVPALVPAMESLAAWFEGAAAVALGGRDDGPDERRRVRAAVGHALAFETWRSLTRRQGLSRAEAVALMAALARRAPAA